MVARKQAGTQKRVAKKARQVGYVVVGCGHFAQDAVLPAFKHAKKNSKLVALVSGDPEKHRVLGRRYKVPVFGYDQYDECLALPEVDAVYIVLPNHLHAEYAERAAKAGAHVLCEKPMALSEEQCQRMMDAARDSDVRMMVAYRLHLESANLQAVEAVRKGKLGEPRYFTSSFSMQVQEDNIRVDRDKGGGVIWDIGVYCINAARYLFRAEPTEVFAFAAAGHDARFREVEEGVSAVLRFPDDRLAAFNVSFGATSTSAYQLVCTEGSVRLDNAYDYKGKMTLEVQAQGKTKKRTLPERDQIGPELLYFSQCVLEGKNPEPDGQEGLADVRIITALYESIRTGQPVRLQPFTKPERPTEAQEIHMRPVSAPEAFHAEPPSAG